VYVPLMIPHCVSSQATTRCAAAADIVDRDEGDRPLAAAPKHCSLRNHGPQTCVDPPRVLGEPKKLRKEVGVTPNHPPHPTLGGGHPNPPPLSPIGPFIFLKVVLRKSYINGYGGATDVPPPPARIEGGSPGNPLPLPFVPVNPHFRSYTGLATVVSKYARVLVEGQCWELGLGSLR